MPKYKTGDKTMTLRKYDTIHNTITDLFDSKWFNFVAPEERYPMDIIERPTEYQLRIAIPGAEKDGILVNLDNGSLKISVEGNATSEADSDNKYLYKGIKAFNYSRTIPNIAQYNIVMDEIKSAYKNGILSITMPKAEDAQPKTISVQVE